MAKQKETKKPKTKAPENGKRPAVDEALEALDEIKKQEAKKFFDLPKPFTKMEKIALDGILDWNAARNQEINSMVKAVDAEYRKKIGILVDAIYEDRGVSTEQRAKMVVNIPEGFFGWKPEEQKTTDVEG